MKKSKKWLYACLMMCLLFSLSLLTGCKKVNATEINLKEPEIVSVSAPADVTTALRVTWQPVAQVDGYIIYRREGSSTTWERIKKVAGQSQSYYSNIQLKPGTKYTYTVQSFCKVDGKVYYSSKGTKSVSAVTNLKTPALKSAKCAAYNQIRIDWTPVIGAQGYRIYRKEAGSSKWTLVRRIAGQSKYFCIDSTVVTGKQYYYTVRATCSWDGNLYASGYDTKGIAGMAVLGQTTISSIQLNTSDQVTLKWTSVSGAHGYVIQKSNTQNGTYTKIKTIQSGSTVSWTGSISAGETAYFRIRAYRQESDGSFNYGAFSAVKSVTSQNIEITKYIGDYNKTTIRTKVDQLAQAIGGLQQLSVSGYERVFESEHTGIYLNTQNVSDPANGYYNLVIETINPKILLSGMKVGDTEQTAFAKLKTAGYIDQGQDGEGYERFVHSTKSQVVFVKVVSGKVELYQYVVIDESLGSGVASNIDPRQFKAFDRK